MYEKERSFNPGIYFVGFRIDFWTGQGNCDGTDC